MKRAAALFAAVLLAGAAAPALAEPPPAPDRPLTDPAQEARARALFGDIRCVVCQHESIADSPAGIAADLRGLVRCLLYTSPSPRDRTRSRMPSSA